LNIDHQSKAELAAWLNTLEADYAALGTRGLALDLTRGKPSAEQLALSDALDGVLAGDYRAADGTDTRNYSGLYGLAEARSLFGDLLGVPAQETLVGGNASLSLMYTTVELALTEGLRGPESAWGNNDTVKFLCPAPGYDRHFAICQHLGIEMVSLPMLDTGPDMTLAEQWVSEDATIRGIWCVPRFSNPTGCTYSDETVERIAGLARHAAEHFVVMWDNAYAVHALYDEAPPLAPIRDACLRQDTLDSVFQFGSTSKITFAGAGVGFVSSSPDNLAALTAHMGYATIGPDKVNQLRHVRFLRDSDGIHALMQAHAQILRPKFAAILDTLERELGDAGMGSWTTPGGGYFISFDTLPGLAREVVRLAGDIGVKLTPAGATFPYGNDPLDSNIRLAPSFPQLADVVATAEAFVLCVKLASVRHRLGQ
jgi:hypothetical protein